jgi:hypothetical protein
MVEEEPEESFENGTVGICLKIPGETVRRQFVSRGRRIKIPIVFDSFKLISETSSLPRIHSYQTKFPWTFNLPNCQKRQSPVSICIFSFNLSPPTLLFNLNFHFSKISSRTWHSKKTLSNFPLPANQNLFLKK